MPFGTAQPTLPYLSKREGSKSKAPVRGRTAERGILWERVFTLIPVQFGVCQPARCKRYLFRWGCAKTHMVLSTVISGLCLRCCAGIAEPYTRDIESRAAERPDGERGQQNTFSKSNLALPALQ